MEASAFLETRLPTQMISQALYREFLTTFIIKDKETNRPMQMVRIMGINPEINCMEAIYFNLDGNEPFASIFTEDPMQNGVMNVPKSVVMNLLGNMYDDMALLDYSKAVCGIYERINKGDGVKQQFAPKAHNDRRVIPSAKVNEEALRHMQEVADKGEQIKSE